MTDGQPRSPEEIRTLRAENAGLRERDFADRFGLSEAQLVAAHVGPGVTRLRPQPDGILPRLPGLGEVLGLTRNRSCVMEVVGTYGPYAPGDPTATARGEGIELALAPNHWAFAFAVERGTTGTGRRSLQVFDAAGDAVHKVHLRPASDAAHWQRLLAELADPDQSDRLAPTPAETAPAVAPDPHARRLAPAAADLMLAAVRAQGVEVRLTVGNRGCSQVYTGPVQSLRPTPPWQNILDDRFNLHLRADHIAEVRALERTGHGDPAAVVEVADAGGAPIFRIAARPGVPRAGRARWEAIVAGLPPAGP